LVYQEEERLILVWHLNQSTSDGKIFNLVSGKAMFETF
jgi:hypothetical protein